MRLSNKGQRKSIMRILKYDVNVKKEVVKTFTSGRTQSLKELTEKEADFLLDRLKGQPVITLWSLFDKENPQHCHVLSLCIQYGWSFINESNKEVADLIKLHRWLKEDAKCPVNKPLKSMSKKELSKIIIALEGMIKWKYK